MKTEVLRDWSCDQFEIYAQRRVQHDPTWLEPLKNKDIVCWCQHPSLEVKPRCHCETLLRLANIPDPHGLARSTLDAVARPQEGST